MDPTQEKFVVGAIEKEMKDHGQDASTSKMFDQAMKIMAGDPSAAAKIDADLRADSHAGTEVQKMLHGAFISGAAYNESTGRGELLLNSHGTTVGFDDRARLDTHPEQAGRPGDARLEA